METESETSCIAETVLLTGKKNSCLKLMKHGNPEMLLVHCVMSRENLGVQKISAGSNEVLNSIIKCITVLKANTKRDIKRSSNFVKIKIQTM